MDPFYRRAGEADGDDGGMQPDRRQTGTRGRPVPGRGGSQRLPPGGRTGGQVSRRIAATILFQGTLRYPPNADAARYLIDELRPAIVRLVPNAAVRLVGVTTPTIAALGDRPGVTVVGRVPDIDTELARADLVLVPIRFGSGTRIKILEAFAHRIPVVSTVLGAEGLDVVDECHLLLADTPDAIAVACARLLDDESRRRLVDMPPSLRAALPGRSGTGRGEEDRPFCSVVAVRTGERFSPTDWPPTRVSARGDGRRPPGSWR